MRLEGLWEEPDDEDRKPDIYESWRDDAAETWGREIDGGAGTDIRPGDVNFFGEDEEAARAYAETIMEGESGDVFKDGAVVHIEMWYDEDFGWVIEEWYDADWSYEETT